MGQISGGDQSAGRRQISATCRAAAFGDLKQLVSQCDVRHALRVSRSVPAHKSIDLLVVSQELLTRVERSQEIVVVLEVILLDRSAKLYQIKCCLRIKDTANRRRAKDEHAGLLFYYLVCLYRPLGLSTNGLPLNPFVSTVTPHSRHQLRSPPMAPTNPTQQWQPDHPDGLLHQLVQNTRHICRNPPPSRKYLQLDPLAIVYRPSRDLTKHVQQTTDPARVDDPTETEDIAISSPEPA